MGTYGPSLIRYTYITEIINNYVLNIRSIGMSKRERAGEEEMLEEMQEYHLKIKLFS